MGWEGGGVNKIEFGDCRETMRRWKEQGVKAQTCVTSPPYYGLRDYGHEGQIGLEETPEDYIRAMVEVFRCVWDVLEDDGTLWLNIGDSYVGAMSQHKDSGSFGETLCISKKTQGGIPQTGRVERNRLLRENGLKQKDLIGIPWMLAFALRADGWYLRQDIIWHKPNPMPESVQDRCTKAHEYIFLMRKSQKYYYDIDAIKEKSIHGGEHRSFNSTKKAERNVEGKVSTGNEHPDALPVEVSEFKNKRSVWTVNPKPYAGAHFAIFPSDLIEPCIMAGAPVGGIVLDPFMGSGTTAQVAQNLGRQYLGCELNPEYEKLQKKRVSQMSLELD